MKTPEEVANSILGFEPGSAVTRYAHAQMVQAIEADRAQRDPNEDGTLHGAAIIALRDRASSDLEYAAGPNAAADWIEKNPDDFWERYGARLVDELEADFAPMEWEDE